MEFFFRPRGIALVGATKKMKGGLAILVNLMKGFKGAIYPVNPRYEEIEGLVCYPDVASVPDPVDLAIVFVPGTGVPEILRQAAARGIKGVIIESAGFAESGPEGRALQDEIVKIGRETGVRLWGPNCMGLVDAVNRHVFSFVSPTIWEEGLIPGDVSLIVQSGMLSGGFLIDTMTHGTMGVSKVLSIGNKCDVNETELLEYLLGDPETKAVALYLESIPDGRRFIRLCRETEKPVVVLKGGKSRAGAAAALSHTASLAGNSAVISGALAQAGVTEARDFKQMMDLARGLAMYPEKKKYGPGRVAILTYSGGAGIMSADFLDHFGLATAELSEASRKRLAEVYPPWMPPANPVDLWPAIERNGADLVYPTAMDTVLADENVDAVLLHLFVGGAAMNPDLVSLVNQARKAGKPLFIWLTGSRERARAAHMKIQEQGVPVYRELFRAVECLAAVFGKAGKRR